VAAVGWAATASGSAVDVPPPLSEARRPNILFVVIDDLNAEVGFLGDRWAVTPHLDVLAAESSVFMRAYCQAPICQPSRTSVLTGRYPSHTGVYGLSPNFWEVPDLAEIKTLPQYFREHGYFSAGVGKVFHGAVHPPSFDQVSGWFGGYGPRPEQPLNIDPALNEHPLFDWGPYLEESDTADFKIAQEAVRLMRVAATKDRPFFLSIGFIRPHCPLYAPREWFDLHPVRSEDSGPRFEDEPGKVGPYALKLVNYEQQQPFNRWLLEDGRASEFRRSYRACVSFVDHCLGLVLESLKSMGLADNTIVVVWSDNGVQNGQRNLWWKRTLWEASTRVPLLIKVPGVPARRIECPVGLIDLYPTLCDLAGLPRPKDLDGVSLDGLIAGRKTTHPPVISMHGPGNFSVREGPWRLIHYVDGSEELYNLLSDPDERRNLLAPGMQGSVEAVLEGLRRFVPADPLPFAPGTADFWSDAFPGK